MKFFFLLLLIVANCSFLTAQSTTVFESTMRSNIHALTIKTSSCHYVYPESLSSVAVNNDYLVITCVVREKEIKNEPFEDSKYIIKVNLSALTAINKIKVPMEYTNEYQYGIKINTMDKVSIRKVSEKHSYSYSDQEELIIACNTKEIQNQMIIQLKKLAESYLYKIPQSKTELEQCFNKLQSFFSTYTLKVQQNKQHEFNYEIKNVKISYNDLKMTISFDDYCADCYENKNIHKELIIPVKTCQIYANRAFFYPINTTCDICINNDDGFEVSEKGKKTIVKQYRLLGDEAVVKQGCKLLNAFIDGVILLDYSSPMGTNNTPKQTKPKKIISNTYGQ